MKLIKKLDTGILPRQNGQYIAYTGMKATQFLNTNLEEQIILPNDHVVFNLLDHYAIIKIEETFFKYSLEEKKIITKYDEIMLGRPAPNNKYLKIDLRTKLIKGFDLNTDLIEWEYQFETPNRVIGFLTDGKIIIGRQMKVNQLYCLDFKNGRLLWEMSINDFLTDTPTTRINAPYLIQDHIVCVNEHLEYFAINRKSKNISWCTKQPAKTIGHILDTNHILHSINIIDFYHPKDKNKQEFVYLKMDCINGWIISEIDLTEQFYALQLIPNKGLHTGAYGHFSTDELFLYFAVNNKVIAMNKSNGKLKVIYQHDARLCFSAVIHDKLFYADDNFGTLVFAHEKSLSNYY